jgi:TonB family protein
MSVFSLVDIVRYSAQLAIVIGGAGGATAVFRLPSPRGRLAYWRAVVAACLLLPLVVVFHPFSAAMATRLPFGDVALTIQAVGTAGSRMDVVRLIPAVLLVGAVLRTGYLTLGAWRLYRFRQTSPRVALHPEVEAAVRAVAPAAEFRSCDSIDQPVTFGFVRSIVLVPHRLLDLPLDLQCAVVLHEAFHVVRGDWLNLLAEQLVRTVFWFHPAMWWALDNIQLCREQTIDDLVVRRTGSRQAYVKALMSFADLAPVAAIGAPLLRRRHLARRIKAIATPTTRSAVSSFIAMTGLILASAGSVFGATSLIAVQGQHSQETIYEPGDGVTLPVVVGEVRPFYTERAKEAKIQGTVTMRCVVGRDGRVDDIAVIESLDGDYGLDDAAVEALRRWEFKPGTKDGTPVAVRVTVQMKFTLK